MLAEAVLALGITPGGIPFGSGGSLTDIFFLICSTSDHEHLRILARLSRVINDSGFSAQRCALRTTPKRCTDWSVTVKMLSVTREAQCMKFAQLSATPLLVKLVGEIDHADFDETVAQIRADVRIVTDGDTPELIVIAQSRPGAISERVVQSLTPFCTFGRPGCAC